MKFLLFIDKIYSKIVTAYCICTIPFLLLSLYLYNKLPAYIPSKIGIGGVYSWFRKEFVFILPVLFLIIGILFSKRYANREKEIKEFAIEKDGKIILDYDKTFSSPSLAADFCIGSSNNGWIMWKDKKGQTLDDVYRKKLEEKA